MRERERDKEKSVSPICFWSAPRNLADVRDERPAYRGSRVPKQGGCLQIMVLVLVQRPRTKRIACRDQMRARDVISSPIYSRSMLRNLADARDERPAYKTYIERAQV